MNLRFLLLIGLFVVSETRLRLRDFEFKWNSFKTVFNKTYKSEIHENIRKKIFFKNLLDMEEHNKRYWKGIETFSKGINHFTDMTYDEFANVMLMKPQQITPFINTTRPVNVSVPDSLDWRNYGVVTRVKYQGQCGSCWAFAANGAVESHFIVKHGHPVLVSEQNLVDCDGLDAGCNGGSITNAFTYIGWNNGVDTEGSYPYEARDGPCRFSPYTVGAQLSAYVQPAGDAEAIKESVANAGPVAVLMYASGNFQQYRSGIFIDPECNDSSINHAVVIVGYGRDNGYDYWIIKNSFDTWWGENGFMRIQRGVGMCNIEQYPAYPIVD